MAELVLGPTSPHPEASPHLASASGCCRTEQNRAEGWFQVLRQPCQAEL